MNVTKCNLEEAIWMYASKTHQFVLQCWARTRPGQGTSWEPHIRKLLNICPAHPASRPNLENPAHFHSEIMSPSAKFTVPGVQLPQVLKSCQYPKRLPRLNHLCQAEMSERNILLLAPTHACWEWDDEKGEWVNIFSFRNFLFAFWICLIPYENVLILSFVFLMSSQRS
jgi:hypothetical protein